MPPMPGCCGYLRMVWIDILAMVIAALAMGGLYLIPLNRREDRIFPVWRAPDGALYGPQYISYPYVPQIIGSTVAAVICLTVPIFVVTVFEYRVRSLWDYHAAVFGILKALIAA